MCPQAPDGEGRKSQSLGLGRNAYKILVANVREDTIRRPWYTSEDNIKMELMDTGLEGVVWNRLLKRGWWG
jgi:hypothetical protein